MANFRVQHPLVLLQPVSTTSDCQMVDFTILGQQKKNLKNCGKSAQWVISGLRICLHCMEAYSPELDAFNKLRRDLCTAPKSEPRICRNTICNKRRRCLLSNLMCLECCTIALLNDYNNAN